MRAHESSDDAIRWLYRRRRRRKREDCWADSPRSPSLTNYSAPLGRFPRPVHPAGSAKVGTLEPHRLTSSVWARHCQRTGVNTLVPRDGLGRRFAEVVARAERSSGSGDEGSSRRMRSLICRRSRAGICISWAGLGNTSDQVLTSGPAVGRTEAICRAASTRQGSHRTSTWTYSLRNSVCAATGNHVSITGVTSGTPSQLSCQDDGVTTSEPTGDGQVSPRWGRGAISAEPDRAALTRLRHLWHGGVRHGGEESPLAGPQQSAVAAQPLIRDHPKHPSEEDGHDRGRSGRAGDRDRTGMANLSDWGLP